MPRWKLLPISGLALELTHDLVLNGSLRIGRNVVGPDTLVLPATMTQFSGAHCRVYADFSTVRPSRTLPKACDHSCSLHDVQGTWQPQGVAPSRQKQLTQIYLRARRREGTLSRQPESFSTIQHSPSVRSIHANSHRRPHSLCFSSRANPPHSNIQPYQPLSSSRPAHTMRRVLMCSIFLQLK